MDSWKNRLCCCLNTNCTGAKDPHTCVLQSKNNALVTNVFPWAEAPSSARLGSAGTRGLLLLLPPEKAAPTTGSPGAFAGSAGGDAKLPFTKSLQTTPLTDTSFPPGAASENQGFLLLTRRHWRCFCHPGFPTTFTHALGGGTTSKAVAEQCPGVAVVPLSPRSHLLWHCQQRPGLAGRDPSDPVSPSVPLGHTATTAPR